MIKRHSKVVVFKKETNGEFKTHWKGSMIDTPHPGKKLVIAIDGRRPGKDSIKQTRKHELSLVVTSVVKDLTSSETMILLRTENSEYLVQTASLGETARIA